MVQKNYTTDANEMLIIVVCNESSQMRLKQILYVQHSLKYNSSEMAILRRFSLFFSSPGT